MSKPILDPAEVPVVESHSAARTNRYPWNDLKVGGSFFMADLDKRQTQCLRAAASEAGRRLGKKFAVRKVEGGVRVWRKRVKP